MVYFGQCKILAECTGEGRPQPKVSVRGAAFDGALGEIDARPFEVTAGNQVSLLNWCSIADNLADRCMRSDMAHIVHKWDARRQHDGVVAMSVQNTVAIPDGGNRIV
jgi:hypothetical protein